MKCENARHVQNNVTMQTTAVFVSNLTATVCLMLAISALHTLFQTEGTQTFQKAVTSNPYEET